VFFESVDISANAATEVAVNEQRATMNQNIKLRCTAYFIVGSMTTAAIAQDLAPPLPTGATGESAIPVNLEKPLANPRDFQGVWLPAARSGGGGPGGPPGGGGAPGAGGPPPGAGAGGGGAPGGGGMQAWCQPNRVAFGAGAGFTFGIIQSPTTMVLLNEENQNYRVVTLAANIQLKSCPPAMAIRLPLGKATPW